MKLSYLVAAAGTILALATLPSRADDNTPVTLTLTADTVKTSDALLVLQKETGVNMIVDPTIISYLQPGKLSYPNLAQMLDFLKTMEPGLTYERLYVANDKALPNPSTCYDLVRTFKWLAEQGGYALTTKTGLVSVSNTVTANPVAPAGYREVWYISDEATRQQEYLDAAEQAKERATLAALSSAATINTINQATANATKPGFGQQNGPGTMRGMRSGTTQISPGVTVQN